MLQFLTDYAVPASLVLLMLIAGTELSVADFSRLRQNTKAVVIGAVGPLLALPPIALIVHSITLPPPSVAVGMLLLSLCPNGGISNYYCYLARCNVALSATITAVGTALSLLTIPLWLRWLPAWPGAAAEFPDLPAGPVIAQLVALMAVPMSIGMGLRYALPQQIERAARPLRLFSVGLIALILCASVGTVADALSKLLVAIGTTAALFVLCAMLLGWVLGYGLGVRDQPVLVIEAAVRNIGVALIMGKAMLSQEGFGVFASFLTGYFIVEIAIMMAYARYQSQRLAALA